MGERVTPDARKGRRVKPYTTGEAALELGISRRKVIRLCDAGMIEHYWTPGNGQRRIRVSELERYRKRIS
jgi:excisionase family DNA binding protein